MRTPRAYWPAWAERLRGWKLDAFAAWLLEAGGPFNLLGAQALYFAHPLVGGEQIEAVAHMLEADDEVLAFASYLRNEASA
jgi:hypothetical protein